MGDFLTGFQDDIHPVIPPAAHIGGHCPASGSIPVLGIAVVAVHHDGIFPGLIGQVQVNLAIPVRLGNRGIGARLSVSIPGHIAVDIDVAVMMHINARHRDRLVPVGPYRNRHLVIQVIAVLLVSDLFPPGQRLHKRPAAVGLWEMLQFKIRVIYVIVDDRQRQIHGEISVDVAARFRGSVHAAGLAVLRTGMDDAPVVFYIVCVAVPLVFMQGCLCLGLGHNAEVSLCQGADGVTPPSDLADIDFFVKVDADADKGLLRCLRLNGGKFNRRMVVRVQSVQIQRHLGGDVEGALHLHRLGCTRNQVSIHIEAEAVIGRKILKNGIADFDLVDAGRVLVNLVVEINPVRKIGLFQLDFEFAFGSQFQGQAHLQLWNGNDSPEFFAGTEVQFEIRIGIKYPFHIVDAAGPLAVILNRIIFCRAGGDRQQNQQNKGCNPQQPGNMTHRSHDMLPSEYREHIAVRRSQNSVFLNGSFFAEKHFILYCTVPYMYCL